MTGEVSEAQPGHGEAAPVTGDRRSLWRVLGLVRPRATRIALSALLGGAAVAADIGLIGTAAWLISEAARHPNESRLALAIVGVQFFGLSRGLLRYEERLVGHDAAFRLLADIRVRVYERLEHLAPAGLPAFRRGDLLARFVRDVDSVQDLALRVIPSFTIAVGVGALTVALMWWMLPAAGLILGLALLLAGTVVPWATGALAARREARFALVRGELTAGMVDLTEGASELVAFGALPSHLDALRAHDAALTAIGTDAASTAGVGLSLTTLLAGAASWGCLAAGIPAVLSGRLDGTELAVVTLVPLAAFELVVGLPVASQSLERVRQGAARVFDVMDAPPPVPAPDRAVPLPTGQPHLEVVGVDARYPGAPVRALGGVDLSLAPGRRVAVVGASGAGKSTLAAVVVRFLSPERGSVSLGGAPLGRLPEADLRRTVGLVDQDAHLFDTTIAENLAVGRRDATDGELREILRRVGLGDWVESLPHGLDTEVGRNGARLSGGQRQRIAVARALLAEFDVLVVDEPAEHLDPEAADALTADLLEVGGGRSLIIITHRVTGLDLVDAIVVMEAGQVIERVTRDPLPADGGRTNTRSEERCVVGALPEVAPIPGG